MAVNGAVRFIESNKSTYESLPHKDDSALYFLKDTNQIYKGNDLYADGTVSANNTFHLYELSEDEFWNKYNSGELVDGLYKYAGNSLGFGIFSTEVPISPNSPILETEDKCYIATYVSDIGSILSVINRDGDLLGQYNLSDMMQLSYSTYFVVSYPSVNRCHIGIDDSGYIYVNTASFEDSDNSGSRFVGYGVIAINTNDIDNPDSWSLVEGLSGTSTTLGVAFAPYNLLIKDRWEVPEIPKYLKTADGGVFAFDRDLGENPYHFRADPFRIHYLKAGKLVFSTDQSCYGGPSSLSVDYENNMLYTLTIIDNLYEGRSQICVKQISIDGTTKTYPIFVDSSLSSFDTNKSKSGSLIYYSNNKVFVYIANTSGVVMVLDIETEEYEIINRINDVDWTDITFRSNIHNNGTSISFIVTGGEYGYETDSLLLSWNYVANTVMIKNFSHLIYNWDFAQHARIRTNADGDIVLGLRDSENSSICVIDPNTHAIKYQSRIDKKYDSILYTGSPDSSVYVMDTSNVSYTGIGSILVIDETGNTSSQKSLGKCGSNINIIDTIKICDDYYFTFCNSSNQFISNFNEFFIVSPPNHYEHFRYIFGVPIYCFSNYSLLTHDPDAKYRYISYHLVTGSRYRMSVLLADNTALKYNRNYLAGD